MRLMMNSEEIKMNISRSQDKIVDMITALVKSQVSASEGVIKNWVQDKASDVMGHVDASKDVITTKVEDKAGDVKQHATALKEEI